jgi:hypothetical protein
MQTLSAMEQPGREFGVFVLDEEGEFAPRWLEAGRETDVDEAIRVEKGYKNAGFETMIVAVRGEA